MSLTWGTSLSNIVSMKCWRGCGLQTLEARYLDGIPLEKWTWSYDGGLRYGHMTSNLAECINSILKGTHHFVLKGSHVWCKLVLKDIGENAEITNSMTSVCHSQPNLVFRVKQPVRPNRGVISGANLVDLIQMTCGCRRFQALRYSCTHAIAACASKRIDCMTYAYWKSEFSLVLDESMWPPPS
ncbi:hypothetical protein PVK06_029993 [Gossypium arboreum]|uniref:SWIM-type domain-containing protein n=1 Tax=Gossypium arboreum TaxID=29729 RepID=A0ABR0NN24_GOSAR|nr:hypothetical protein PVK06_029993 [Gossypium arboreum]